MEQMCAVEECGKPAKVDGMCVRHACEAAKRQHLLAADETCRYCGRMRVDVTGWTESGVCGTCASKRPSAPHPIPSAKRKETEVSEDMKSSVCCVEPEGRTYAGRCKKCRDEDRAARKEPSPRRGEGKGEGEEKAPQKRMGGGSVKEEQPITHNERVAAAAIGVSPRKLRKEIEKNRPKSRGLSESELITAVKGSLNYHLEEARRCHTTLVVLKDMTGADVEIPEVRL